MNKKTKTLLALIIAIALFSTGCKSNGNESANNDTSQVTEATSVEQEEDEELEKFFNELDSFAKEQEADPNWAPSYVNISPEEIHKMFEDEQ